MLKALYKNTKSPSGTAHYQKFIHQSGALRHVQLLEFTFDRCCFYHNELSGLCNFKQLTSWCENIWNIHMRPLGDGFYLDFFALKFHSKTDRWCPGWGQLIPTDQPHYTGSWRLELSTNRKKKKTRNSRSTRVSFTVSKSKKSNIHTINLKVRQ